MIFDDPFAQVGHRLSLLLRASVIDAARQSGAFLDCHVSWWSTQTALAVDGGAAPIALDVHLEDGGVMHEAVDGGECHGLVGEHLAPLADGGAQR
jgi:hypothetical protein